MAAFQHDPTLPPVGRVCVVTAIFHDYDYLREIPPRFRESGVDYYCITDDPSLRSSSYQVVPVDPVQDGRLATRRIKMLLDHPLLQQGYDHYVWLDATVMVRSRLTSLLPSLQLSGSDMQAFLYNGRRQPWGGLLAWRASERQRAFGRIWFERTLRTGRGGAQIRDEFVFFESVEAAGLAVNLLPLTVLPFYGMSNRHKDRSLHPALERWLLSNPLSIPAPWSLVWDFPVSFLFKRRKLAYVGTTLRKIGVLPGWRFPPRSHR